MLLFYGIFYSGLTAQVEYFNIVYPQAIEGVGTIQGTVFNSTNGYVSLGFHGQSGILGTKVNFDGSVEFVTFDFHFVNFQGSSGGGISENYVTDEDGNYYTQHNGYSTSNESLPYISKLNLELDTLWNWLPDWAMNESDDFFPLALTILDNANVLSISLARYGYFGGGDEPDSTGLRFTQLDPDGNLVSSYVAIYPSNVYCSEFVVYAVRHFQNELILWGRTSPNCQSDRQNFVLKTTMEGDILEEFYWGNPNECMEMGFSGILLETGQIVFSYPRCEEFLSPAESRHEEHLMLFDLATMDSISDIGIPIAEMNQYVGPINTESMVESNDANYVSVFNFWDINSEVLPYVTPRIFKVNNSGELLWYREYASGMDTFIESLYDIENAPDGGYILTGVVELVPTYAQRHWMVKIDSCGYEQPGFCFPDAVVERENLEVKLWPNPTHHVLKAQLPVSAESVELYNAAGRLIFSEKVYHRSQQWNIRELECGVYFLRVLLEDGSVVTERVVKV